MSRVLVVEDERKVLRGLARGLEGAGYAVHTASNGEDGLRHALVNPIDCLILDILLPARNGLEILAELRRAGRSYPVLLLTARDTIEDRVRGLDAGADDYLVKPFAFAELLARVRVLLRRGVPDQHTLLRAVDLEMDLLHRRVVRCGVEVSLTQREFELLEYFLRHKNAVVTREMLGRDVWKEPAVSATNVVEVYVNFLRRKIEKQGCTPLIRTIRGVGYTLEEVPPCA